MGTGVYCVGCGKFRGITTVSIESDWQPPEQEPDYPFDEVGCPICALVDSYGIGEPWPMTIDELAKLPLSLLRQALAIKKAESRDVGN